MAATAKAANTSVGAPATKPRPASRILVIGLTTATLMSEPPAAIAALSESDQRALRDIVRRAAEHLREPS